MIALTLKSRSPRSVPVGDNVNSALSEKQDRFFRRFDRANSIAFRDEDSTHIAFAPRNAMTIQILEQGDRVFAR